LLSLFSFILQPNGLFHYQDNSGYYLFITGATMMDAFQSTRVNTDGVDISTISPHAARNNSRLL